MSRKSEFNYDEINLSGKVDGVYGKDYYNSNNPLAPFSETSFTDADVFPKKYVNELIARTYEASFKNKKVLDIACCRGAYVKELCGIGADAYGIDFSEYARDTKVIEDSRYICHDLLTGIPFDPEIFDFVLANDILEHFVELDSIFLVSEIWNTMKDGAFAHINIGCGVAKEHILLMSFEWWEGQLKRYFDIRYDLMEKFNNLKSHNAFFSQLDWPNLFIVQKIG